MSGRTASRVLENTSRTPKAVRKVKADKMVVFMIPEIGLMTNGDSWTRTMCVFLFFWRTHRKMSKKLILSIDGGGVRGQFDLDIISRIEDHFGRTISDMFDMVVGVSAGAMTAVAIAGESYDRSISEITVDFTKVFDSKQELGPVMETKYDGKGKTSLFREYFGEKTLGDVTMPVVILASSINGELIEFTNTNPNHVDLKLSNVVDASTAAPVYFPPVLVDGHGYCIDGGIISNDPVIAAVMTAKKIWGEKSEFKVMSLGTGTVTKINIDSGSLNSPRKFGLVKWLSEGLIDILTMSNEELLKQVIPLIVGKNNYIRITSTVVGNMDDTSEEMTSMLHQNAGKIWNMYNADIVTWMKKALARVSDTVEVDPGFDTLI